MSLEAIRDQARATIHDQFTIAAVVRSPDGSVTVDVGARLHIDGKKPFGDLDREGFALVIEEYNQVIFDRQQWEPQKGWSVDFGRGRVYNLVNFLGPRSARYIKMEITEKK